MRTEIYMEGRRLDISADISSQFTYQIDDIKDFASRNTNFSKTIVIPGTSYNNAAFGHVFEFGSANAYDPNADNFGYNFNAAVQAECAIFVDNIQIMKGVLRLLEIIVDGKQVEYECAVFGELGGFATALGNARLEDLDFSAYDHEWNWANISASWEEATGAPGTGYYPASGYYYPLIDYGNVSYSNKHDWDVKAFRPALYVREYMDKIITGAGYTWEGSFLDTKLFRRLIIPQNNKDLLKVSDKIVDAKKTTTQTLLDTLGDAIANVQWDNTILSNATEDGQKAVFTFTGGFFTSITIDFDFYGNYQSENDVTIKIVKNSTAIATHTLPATGSNTVAYSWTGSVDSLLSTNDTLKVEFSVSLVGSPTFNVQILNTSYFIVRTPTTQSAVANWEDQIQVNANIPKGVFQRDFFSSIVKMFNLYVYEDKDRTKHIKITPYIDFYGTEIIDWSDKLDRSKPIRLRPMSEINGRYFEFKYKPDNDYYNENYQKKYTQGYGDRLEDTGFEFANDKQTLEVVFSATVLVGYNAEEKVYPTIFKLSGSTEESMEHNIRIMQVKKVTGLLEPYKVVNGDIDTEIATNLTTYGYAGHLDDPDVPEADINFGSPRELFFTLQSPYPSANLFNGYWSDYLAEITDKDSKLLSAFFKLDETDIGQLDFSKFIRIDGVLFRLNRIEDYDPLNYEMTKVELLRVIELTYE